MLVKISKGSSKILSTQIPNQFGEKWSERKKCTDPKETKSLQKVNQKEKSKYVEKGFHKMTDHMHLWIITLSNSL